MASIRFLSAELRRAREEAGMTQEQLGQAINYSASMVAAVESARRIPKKDFIDRADAVLDTRGLLGRILKELLSEGATPEWFRPWLALEQEATAIWTFEPLAIPGLFQTEAYARAQLEEDEGQIAARLERQQILTRDNPPPPSLVVLLDERVLRYPVGGPEVMKEQLEYLADMAARFIIQIIPVNVGTYRHLDGSFVIATVDGKELVYVDTPARGFVIEAPETVPGMKRRWDTIRAEALSRGQSMELIREVAEQW